MLYTSELPLRFEVMALCRHMAASAVNGLINAPLCNSTFLPSFPTKCGIVTSMPFNDASPQHLTQPYTKWWHKWHADLKTQHKIGTTQVCRTHTLPRGSLTESLQISQVVICLSRSIVEVGSTAVGEPVGLSSVDANWPWSVLSY